MDFENVLACGAVSTDIRGEKNLSPLPKEAAPCLSIGAGHYEPHLLVLDKSDDGCRFRLQYIT